MFTTEEFEKLLREDIPTVNQVRTKLGKPDVTEEEILEIVAKHRDLVSGCLPKRTIKKVP